MSDPLVLLVQFAATWTMVGIIWFVQVVHYPLFSRVDGPGSGAYAVENQRRTSWVVGPPMAAEGVTALWLAASPPGGVGRVLPVVGLVLLALVLGSTVLLQVPAHARLVDGHDPSTVRRLVSGNWVRTVGWSARGALVAAMVVLATR
jgi:fatty acid desaturase